MDMGMYKVADFNKVFEVLKQIGFDHKEGKTVDACFKDWNKSINLDDYEEVLAYLIRLILMDEAIKFLEKLERLDCDMRDILLVLVVKGMGLDRVSQIVEAAEKGLKAFYDEKDYEALSICLEVMLKDLEEKINKIEKAKEVMLQ
jgi:hypothetical protein